MAAVGPDSVTNAFIAAMAEQETRTVGENNHPSLTEWGVAGEGKDRAGKGDQRVGFWNKLVRGLTRVRVQEFVRNIVASAVDAESKGRLDVAQQIYVDLFVLAFETRDIIEGKGERDLFYWLFMELVEYFPQTCVEMIPLIPDMYGSWKDLNTMRELFGREISQNTSAFRLSARSAGLKAMDDAMRDLYISRLVQDGQKADEIQSIQDKIDSSSDDEQRAVLRRRLADIQLSLVGKWAPRQKSKFGSQAREMALRMYFEELSGTMQGKSKNEIRQRCFKQYRQLCSRLNTLLGTSEVKMCARQFSSLNPAHIPARCLKINRKAFMNQTKTGEQRSTLEDRIRCANTFSAFLKEALVNPSKAKVHGKKLLMYEIVSQYMKSGSSPDPVLEAQWVDLRTRTKQKLREIAAEEGISEKEFMRFVTMVDVSGSMNGRPMEVAIAMGILISEVCHPQFRDTFLTFHTNPTWHKLNPSDSLYQKVRSSVGAGWGMSTDFEKALGLILDRCVQAKLPSSVVSELTFLVLSDMQFNAATGSSSYYGSNRYNSVWATQYQRIQRAFNAAGYECPQIVFWNLRGDTFDFPCSDDTPGVQLLSGFSANALKHMLNGEELVKENPPTPYETMRKALDDERYDPVRLAIARVGEDRLSGYTPPVQVEEEDTAQVSPVTLIVENLGESVTNVGLLDIFESRGVSVLSTKLFTSRENIGCSTGCAEVVVKSSADADLAIGSFDGVPLDGRPMMVSIKNTSGDVRQNMEEVGSTSGESASSRPCTLESCDNAAKFRCANCKAGYCGRDHQKADWAVHKNECVKLGKAPASSARDVEISRLEKKLADLRAHGNN